MLTLADVSKSYATRTLFSEVSLFIARTDRYGLVGPNGAGKTTLFNLILGQDAPDDGTIEWERGADFGYLPQESAPIGEETILEIATSGKKLLPDSDDDFDIDYSLEPRAKKILAGLGFRESDHLRQAKSFSGGWVMRAHIARLLVSEPALLLLDEPTNHLDLEALLWFQDYLRLTPAASSSSRTTAPSSTPSAPASSSCAPARSTATPAITTTTSSKRRPARTSNSPPSKTSSAKSPTCKNSWTVSAPRPRWPRAPSPRKNKSSASKKSPSRSRRRTCSRMNFKFSKTPRSGLKVVTLEHVQQAYGDHVVYRDLNFAAERGQRIVLVGPNGAGKSTFLKILAGVVPIQGGTLELGSNVVSGYFAQNRAENLRTNATVLENVMELRTARRTRCPSKTSARSSARSSSARTTSTKKSPSSPAAKNPASPSPASSSTRPISS